MHQKKMLDQELEAARGRLLEQHEALAALTKSQVFRGEDLHDTFRLLTETVARVLDIGRVSLWRYTDDRGAITCLDLYELHEARHSAGAELRAVLFPAYFQALSASEAIIADDAHRDPRTREFSGSYLTPLGITAMMDIPLILYGRLEGVLCHEQIGPQRPWLPEDRLFGIAVANLAALAIEQTERKRVTDALRDSEARMRGILNAATDCIVTMDHQGRIVEFNPAAERTFGYARAAAIGEKVSDLLIPEALRGAHETGFARYRETGFGPAMDRLVELRGLRADGTEFPVELHVTRIGSEGPPHFTAYLRDITERKASEARIQHLAYHDPLTALPNRTLLLDRLDHALAEARRHHRGLAVLFVDLDNFKSINDTLGHPIGDRLLKEASARMTGVLRAEDTVARVGGDEFVVLLPNVPVAGDPALVASKAIEALAAPFRVQGHELHVTASIGIGVYPRDGEDRETLLRHADSALYQAKDRGRNTYQFFDPEINRLSHERLALESALRRALERHELLLHYQAQQDLGTLAVTGVEALLRWQHPERGLIGPAAFMAVAEESGLIVPIGAWVLRRACAEAMAWRRSGLPRLRVAVNVSARELRQDTFVPGVREAVVQTGMDPSDVEIEITESSVMHDAARAVHTLGELKSMGLRLAMDDFGTGYSSLSYLKRFPLDRIKIDRSFVRDIPADPDDVGIVQAIVAMAHQLRLGVVAEGVETEEQYAFLGACGCDAVQGYLVSPPIPAEDFSAFLRMAPERPAGAPQRRSL